jgi:hypothetical protein
MVRPAGGAPKGRIADGRSQGRHNWAARNIGRFLLVVSLAVLAALGTAAPVSAAERAVGRPVPASQEGIAGWTRVGSYGESTLTAGEGVATVFQPREGSYELYRGIFSVPSNLAAQGWTHIGDPDSLKGYVIDAYQGSSSGGSKMFLVTTPSGLSFQYVHLLVPGELYNNSFAAISPDTQWMVAGEWGTMSHLQIYPTPLLDHRTSSDGGPLALAGYIELDHRVNDIQGCDFVTPVRLICVSDDSSRTLFTNEKPLLEVDLSSSLHGRDVTGHVSDLGSIPEESRCSGTFEAEGVDFDRPAGVLRVEMIQPGSCILTTTVYEYQPSRRA